MRIERSSETKGPNESKSRSSRLGRSRFGLLGLAGGLALTAAFACTSAGTNEFTTSSSGSGAGSTGSGAGSTGSGASHSGSGGSGGENPFVDSGPMTSPVAIQPTLPTVKVELPLNGQSIQFTCMDVNTQMPVANATWSLDNIALGTISTNGLYTPNGAGAGKVKVTCSSGAYTSSTTLTILIHALDNQGGLTQNQQGVLKGPPGLSDGQWNFLYPYNNTVFPRGILAPEIHLTTGTAPSQNFFVHILAPNYEYEGFFTVSSQQTQIQMSQAAWEALTQAAAGGKVQVEVSKLFNGQKYGPIFETWTLAAGSLHGTVYYNTYDSPLAQNNGAMMRIKGNSPTPEVLAGNCTVCHSVSADGSTAAAANHSGQGGIFDLTGGMVNPPLVWQDSELAAFAAIYPKNGQYFVTNGAPSYSWPPNTPGTSAQWLSALYTKNGMIVPNSGIETFYAMSPVFSPDGTKIAFNDRSPVAQGGWYPGVLAMMDFNVLTQKFSNYQVLATPQPGRQFSWPAFTPDGKYVVYQDGVGEDLATWSGNTGKLMAVNTITKQVTYLANLNGDGYMPQGARDENKNYEPTIAPIASGGYFWVMFTSRRTYGNKLTGSDYETKRLWVSAFNVNAMDGIDASHPAFYISGQELTSGNSRGFWALDPCKADGQSCATGDECCNGYCNPTNDPAVFVCGPPNGMCSDEFEPCVTADDCCNPTLDCIGGKCTQIPPQ